MWSTIFKLNAYEMFKRNLIMFLDLQGSCDQKINGSQENLPLKCGFRFLLKSLGVALESPKVFFDKVIILVPFWKNIFKTSDNQN